MPVLSRWDRKSVSQLVQHYQSCSDLRCIGKYDETQDADLVDGRWRGVIMDSSRVGLSRSQSMDALPQRGVCSTKALCALFESKSSMHGGSSLQHLTIASEGALQDWKKQKQNQIYQVCKPRKMKRHKSNKDFRHRGDTSTQSPKDSSVSTLRELRQASFKDNNSGSVKGSPIQGRNRIPTSSSVRERSALYLSCSTDTPGGSEQSESTGSTQGKKPRVKKMDVVDGTVTVSHTTCGDDDLPPPPPPPPVPPRPLDYDGPSSGSPLPPPPPKETFSTYYQQRQKSELKRLFKHIHPDLRASLDDVAEEDLMRAVQTETSQTAEGSYQAEVQSMRWIFENWTLDNIGDPHGTKKLLDEEDLTGGDVRGTTSKFEHTNLSQPCTQRQASVCGDVRTSAWLFETQPLSALSKSSDGSELVEAVLKEPIQAGDVKGNRLLFESTPLGDLGRCNSVEDHSFLKLKSELQEQKGDVQKTVKLFQAGPNCAIKDKRGNFHRIKSICREEINSSDISTARWLFETQPLDLINKDTDKVKIIRGISLEEGQIGGVGKKRWMFETQPIDTIHEMMGGDKFEGTVVDCETDADVVNKTKLFETNPLSALKGDSAEKTPEKDEIIGGDVKSSLWLFETQPMETLHDNYEIGQLQKITLSPEEQGEVKGKKHIFESCSTQTKVMTKEQEIEKGDVKTFKHLFETIPLSKIARSVEHVENKETKTEAGNVQENKELFERSNLYAIKDSSGNLHKVTAISREESIKGQVQNYKWLFETKPLDEQAEKKGTVEVIKGITRQEDTMGDVKTAKWLFETQTIDGIHMKFNQPNQSSAHEEQRKGDVKTCKWLFETHPLDLLYDKSEKATEKEAIDSTDVKSITWMFESQPLDSIKDGEQYNLKLCSTIQDTVKPELGVQTVKHLFETETLDRIQKDACPEVLHCVSQVDLQSGDVSRVKELFESQSLDEIGLEMTSLDSQNHDESIEKGSVHKVTWLFDNCPLNKINKDNKEETIQKVGDAEFGDVKHKKFIFETSSLDKIHEEELEQRSEVVKPTSSIDVKTSTMMFESTPLYAIRDKEGQFHEVTTVKKEEVLSGDVRGARWMFETKPLDAIKAENEVYVIRAVTQEDVEKGDVKSARWKFETQPLDTLTEKDTPTVKDFEEFGSGNVKQNKQIFESNQASKKVKRMVSVTDVQSGDVRTSTWLFENQSIDSLKGESEEQSQVQTVHREDSQKGDVKRCTWLFESQPLDKIKEQESSSAECVVAEIPKSDVKCTTWLFETTPLDKITATNVVDTLSYLHDLNFVHSSGIIIEGKDSQNVSMAKYCTESNRNVQIHKEETVGGNIRNIIIQLLHKPTLKPQITLLREVEKGNVKTTVLELPVYQSSSIGFEKDQRIQNIVQRIDELLSQDKTFKRGLIMQETVEGQAEMSVYSLLHHCATKTDVKIEKGDVKSTIGNLLATANESRTAISYRVDKNEKGNVNLYKRCIEEGDLKSLHAEDLEDEVDNCHMSQEQIEIVQGDVKEAKRSLCQQKEQVERTVSDVLPGDVKNTKKVFSSETSLNVENFIPKDEIIPGDVLMAKQQLAVKQQSSVEKEEIVSGDIKAAMQSLERAKQQSMTIEREMIKPGTIYDMDLSGPDMESETKQIQKEVIISGDVKAAKKSLEMAKQQSMNVEREVVVPGKIYNLNVSTQEEPSTTTSSTSSSRCQQVKTYPKVSDLVKHRENNASFEAYEHNSVVVSNGIETLSKYECNGHANEDETGEVIRGDIKAAIRSLQSAVSEQKSTDKEDIVKGNVQLALQSLERSSVNVSKGDYKAAMIYRNSGRSKTVTKPCVEMPVPPSDTKLSPSISVTHEEASTTAPSISVDKGNFQLSSCTNTASALAPSSEKTHNEKPALPPKPQWTKYVLMEEEKPSSDTICSPTNNVKNAGTFPSPTYCQSEAAPVMDEVMNTQEIKVSSPQISDESSGLPNVIEMERNVTQKINAAEEIQMCMKKYAEEGNHETNLSVKAALQNFERKDAKRGSVLCKMVKVTVPKDTDSFPEPNFPPSLETHTMSTHVACNEKQEQQDPVQKVVLREKKVRETEEQRRQRLSVHMDEIVRGNVQVAMEIFDNLRKRDELQGVLDEVHEIEGDRRSMNDKSLKKLYKNYPVWAAAETNAKHETMDEKFDADSLDDDLESISSVDTAYEDLEKASKEILLLKEQTIAKLLDIEETIKKALYSVSNLKSEADIAGLSGLF
ncbi:xin actin-binding repeat-containing protein 1, partial [Boleophthalmus pectinirostris]|uniref:xin actin-binding repeat-containing protein 1 n=1 Tax=Boleophthalmus pectinirostris TaxID=150288 RepID=UPI00242B332F